MKNKKLILEQAAELDKFFYPGCFEYGEPADGNSLAKKVTITINGVQTPAIKKYSKVTPGKIFYYTGDMKKYTLENGVMKSVGDWSCKAAAPKAVANPATEYFNKLGLDLTKPDSLTALSRAVQEINLAIRAGGMSDEFQDFREFYDIIKNDKTINKDNKLPELTQTTNSEFASRFNNTFGREFTPFASPYDTEIGRFNKKQIRVGNKTITYYIWNAGSTQTKTASTYNAQVCYQFLTDYIERIDRGEISNIDDLGNEKQTLFACYNPFWYNNKLNDENRTGKIKLGLGGKEKKYLIKLLPQLMQDRGETAIPIGSQQQSRPAVYESLETKLRKALLESVNLKKKV